MRLNISVDEKADLREMHHADVLWWRFASEPVRRLVVVGPCVLCCTRVLCIEVTWALEANAYATRTLKIYGWIRHLGPDLALSDDEIQSAVRPTLGRVGRCVRAFFAAMLLP